MSTDLMQTLAAHIDALPVPSGDLDAARTAGRRRRRMRRAGAAALGVAVVGATGGLALAVGGGDDQSASDPSYASVGRLDFTDGVRAYADPGNKIWLGGREFDAKQLSYLDTDSVATSNGVVFFDDGRPMLLDATGTVSKLVTGKVDGGEDFHPTAKADARSPLVAWATRSGDTTTITVRNLDTGADIASTTADCGRCSGMVIDAIDDGVVFVRDKQGTRTWDTTTDSWRDFAGPDTRVADVRNGVVLYSGLPPTEPGGRTTVEGPVDGQLTFDGKHVVAWSSTLQPTSPDDDPLVLTEGPRKEGQTFGWYAVDTDGSVLVATGKAYNDYTVHDCEIPSGACTRIGTLKPTGGDPAFIGVDM